MNGKEISRSYDGPIDPTESFELLLGEMDALLLHYDAEKGYEAAKNLLRLAYQLGRRDQRYEYSHEGLEPNIP